MKKLLILFVLASVFNIKAQNVTDSTKGVLSWKTSEFNAGVSIDPVAYYYGGYDGSFWLSYYYFKLRANYSLKYPPEFVNDGDFRNLAFKSFGVYFDYFPFTTGIRLNGIWFSLGAEASQGSVQNYYTETTGEFNDYFLTGSFGYLWFFSHSFYLNPFFAGHLRVLGDRNLEIDGSFYSTPRFIPEISVRIGYHF